MIFLSENVVYNAIQDFAPIVFTLTMIVLGILILRIEHIKSNPMVLGLMILVFFFIIMDDVFSVLEQWIPSLIQSGTFEMLFTSLAYLIMMLWALGAINIVLKFYRNEKEHLTV